MSTVPTSRTVPILPALSLVSPPEDHPRAVVIGTESTLGRLLPQLGEPGPWPIPVAAVVVDAPAGSIAGAGPAVVGGLHDLASIVPAVDAHVAIVSIPASMRDEAALVRSALRRLDIEQRDVPTLEDLLAQPSPGRGGPPAAATLLPLPRIDLAALIGRQPHAMDTAAVSSLLRGRRVLITGAGGSIGSELARIAARFEPSRLVLVERAENALFEIDRRLAHAAPDVDRRAVLHDVVDEARTRVIVERHRPDVVFHAAAHKHVPLMEDHPAHAVDNNLFGTRSIVDAAVAAGASHFVLVSTDKAVRPASVMGATKRLAELYVQHAGCAPGSTTRTSIVRFGNVLGSACSVLTIWSAQLADGGPLTVTDARMTRYFMTIPEAASLVIQSAALDAPAGGSSPVYVLDMGAPISIMELASRFARAHGFEPRTPGERTARSEREPVDIVTTGVRPGEKLHEQLSYADEELRPTSHPGISAWVGGRRVADTEAMVRELSAVRASLDRECVLRAIRRHVPEMVEPEARGRTDADG